MLFQKTQKINNTYMVMKGLSVDFEALSREASLIPLNREVKIHSKPKLDNMVEYFKLNVKIGNGRNYELDVHDYRIHSPRVTSVFPRALLQVVYVPFTDKRLIQANGTALGEGVHLWSTVESEIFTRKYADDDDIGLSAKVSIRFDTLNPGTYYFVFKPLDDINIYSKIDVDVMVHLKERTVR